jgi:hypothetical protein
MRVRQKTNKRKNVQKKNRSRNRKTKMKGGSAPMSELGNVFSNLGFLSQSAMNMFSVPIPTIVGQTSTAPLMTQQFTLIKPLLLD